jgi:hypothetical protein
MADDEKMFINLRVGPGIYRRVAVPKRPLSDFSHSARTLERDRSEGASDTSTPARTTRRTGPSRSEPK